MTKLEHADYEVLADAYAFVGNSLLKPMSMTAKVGLDPDFWNEFPDFGDEATSKATHALAKWACCHEDEAEDALVDEVSYEFTKLFVGPPKPSAAPWETMYKGEDGKEVTVAFGDPTFQMRQLLRDMGLELSNENNQFEDHIGIELLYLSELCRRVASEDGSADGASQVESFVEEHPLSFIDDLRAKVEETFPDSYYLHLIELAKALCEIPSR